MIGLLDTFTLARTKLRSKRILLIITVIVSGLVFGVLSGAIMVATGVTRSTEHFFTKALNGRYLVEATPNIPSWVYSYEDTFNEPSAELVKKLTDMQDAYIAKQKAIYDKHKITFDKTMVAPILQPNPYGQKDSAGNATLVINRDSPVYQDYLKQRQLDYIKTATNKVSDLQKIAKKYGAADYHYNQSISLESQATYLKNGQEELGKKQPADATSYQDYLTTNVQNSSYTFTDQSLLSRFILPANKARQQTTDAIPVVLTTQEIAKVFGKELGIGKQPSDPTAQVAWMKDLQQKANGYVYSVCYRSTSEMALIQKTMQMNTEMVAKKNDPTYSAPSLQYTLPTTPCGELTVKKDSRSAQQKQVAAAEESLQKDLGTYQPAEHQLLRFQIVGTFTITDFTSQPQNATAYISYLLGPMYTRGSFIPQQLYDKLPAAAKHEDLLKSTGGATDYKAFEDADIKGTVVTFPTLTAARDFIKQEGCSIDVGDCKKPFILATYGSSYLAVDDISTFIASISPIALGIAMTIATIIIWITMARVIIDSRRETAVFRALGAKRRDIVAVYLLYSMLVAVLITLFMLLLGLGIATVVDGLYSADATSLAKVAYGVFDNSIGSYHFMGINVSLLGILVAALFGICLLAVLPPLWRNVRRSPIRDMRDE